jgi:hypothetical protein
MSFTYAKVLADSVNPVGVRLTTWELRYPRIIHAEVLTHGMLVRNSASSRAIPNSTLIHRVLNETFMPNEWGTNQKGMQAGEPLSPELSRDADSAWLHARDLMVETAKRLTELGVHKQLANRVLEPWMHITVILSGTDLANFYHLRYHTDAEPHFQELARKMYESQQASTPKRLQVGQWHRPLWRQGEDDLAIMPLFEDGTITWSPNGPEIGMNQVAVGRIARVSFLTHDGQRDLREDVKLHNRLVAAGHWSPFAHVAQAMPNDAYVGQFRGWFQYRKAFKGENVLTFDGPATQAA